MNRNTASNGKSIWTTFSSFARIAALFLPCLCSGEIAGASPGVQAGPIGFIPMSPCRVIDTRNAAGPFGGPLLSAQSIRDFNPRQSGCGILQSAAAYSLNVTVVPRGPLRYLTLWPSGQPRPIVSTLNSYEGNVVANAAIVPAGVDGAVSVYVPDDTDLIVDINGFFDPTGGVAFYPIPPCRLLDTRNPTGPLGGPTLTGGSTRAVPVRQGSCRNSDLALGYALNATVVPSGPLSYLTLWPSGFSQPVASTLNSFTGAVVANSALVPAGADGAVNAYATDGTDLILDMTGYFKPQTSPSGLRFYPVTPCRIADTRNPAAVSGQFGGPALSREGSREFPIPSSNCGIPGYAQAYSLNVTVAPLEPLSYLTIYPSGLLKPEVSTLNSFDGRVVANAALVPAGYAGSVTVYASNTTDVIIDINGYFAP